MTPSLIQKEKYKNIKEKLSQIEKDYEKALIDFKMAEDDYEKALIDFKMAEDDLEDAGYKYESAETELDIIGLEKSRLENLIKELEIEEYLKTKTFTGDKFMGNLTIASWYCIHEVNGIRSALENIKINDNTLFACNGYQAIEIKCESIPDEYKNSYIHWKFDNVPVINKTNHLEEYPDLQNKILNEDVYNHREIVDISYVKNKWIGERDKEFVYIKLGDIEYMFKTDLLTSLFNALIANKQGEIFYSENHNPIMIVTENIKIAVMPMRYKK